jgi:hypothetical protein
MCMAARGRQSRVASAGGGETMRQQAGQKKHASGQSLFELQEEGITSLFVFLFISIYKNYW